MQNVKQALSIYRQAIDRNMNGGTWTARDTANYYGLSCGPNQPSSCFVVEASAFGNIVLVSEQQNQANALPNGQPPTATPPNGQAMPYGGQNSMAGDASQTALLAFIDELQGMMQMPEGTPEREEAEQRADVLWDMIRNREGEGEEADGEPMQESDPQINAMLARVPYGLTNVYLLDSGPWQPYTGKRGGKGWKNTQTGRVVYTQSAEAPGSARRAREASGTRAKEIGDRVLYHYNAPHEADAPTEEELQELATHLPKMTAAHLQQLRGRLLASFKGGGRREQMVDALRAHVAQLVKNKLDKGKLFEDEPEKPNRQSKDKAKAPKGGTVTTMDTDHLHVDPERFQFKLNTNKEGVTDELKGVQKFNPDLGGVLAVWHDPADGKTYVVNGHHRHELAKRTGHGKMAVRYIDAKDAQEARAKGALINIAEGKGTAVDAAKFMRDMDVKPEHLAEHGISLKGALARDAGHLRELAPALFSKVARGQMETERAVAIGKHLAGKEDLQLQLANYIDKKEEATGRDWSPKMVEEAAREVAYSPTTTKDDGGLFGGMTEESRLEERAALKAHVRNQLAKTTRDFQAVASERRAGAVKDAGNVLNVEENQRLAQENAQQAELFDKLANYKGPLADIINQYAEDYANAPKSKRERLQADLVAKVRGHLANPDNINAGAVNATTSDSGEGAGVVSGDGASVAGTGALSTERRDTPETDVEPESDTPKIVGSSKTKDGRELQFVPHANASDDETTVMVDPKKFDAHYREADPRFAIHEDGRNEIKGRREGFRKFLEKGQPIEASRAGFDAEGKPSLWDGRHRLRELTDMGAGEMAMTVPKNQADEFVKRYGVTNAEQEQPTATDESQGSASTAPHKKDYAPGDTVSIPENHTTGAHEADVIDMGSGKLGIRQKGTTYSPNVVFNDSEHLQRFLGDLNGKIEGEPTAPHESINAVLSGQAKFLGRGNDGMAFDAGDGNVVKASTELPFHWNNGVRSAREGAERIRNQVAANQLLIDSGVSGVVPQELHEHGGRAYAVMPKLDTTTPLTADHLEQVKKTILEIHEAGMTIGDDIQVGLDANGKAKIFDTGAARQLNEGRGRREDIEDDTQRLSRLYKQHGQTLKGLDPHTDYFNAVEDAKQHLERVAQRGKPMNANTRERFRKMLEEAWKNIPEGEEVLMQDDHDELMKQFEPQTEASVKAVDPVRLPVNDPSLDAPFADAKKDEKPQPKAEHKRILATVSNAAKVAGQRVFDTSGKMPYEMSLDEYSDVIDPNNVKWRAGQEPEKEHYEWVRQAVVHDPDSIPTDVLKMYADREPSIMNELQSRHAKKTTEAEPTWADKHKGADGLYHDVPQHTGIIRAGHKVQGFLHGVPFSGTVKQLEAHNPGRSGDDVHGKRRIYVDFDKPVSIYGTERKDGVLDAKEIDRKTDFGLGEGNRSNVGFDGRNRDTFISSSVAPDAGEATYTEKPKWWDHSAKFRHGGTATAEEAEELRTSYEALDDEEKAMFAKRFGIENAAKALPETRDELVHRKIRELAFRGEKDAPDLHKGGLFGERGVGEKRDLFTDDGDAAPDMKADDESENKKSKPTHGKPFTGTVYRGESKSTGTGGMSALGAGKYHGLIPEVAQRFSKNGTVKEHQVTLNNPIVINNDDEMEAIKKQAEEDTGHDFGKNGRMYHGALLGDQAEKFTAWAKSKGHDGIITTYKEAPGGEQLLSFAEEQKPKSEGQTKPNEAKPSTTTKTKKEPWEMTRDEFDTTGEPTYGDLVLSNNGIEGFLRGSSPGRYKLVDENDRHLGYFGMDQLSLLQRFRDKVDGEHGYGEKPSEGHRDAVRQAIKEGKDVPQHVLDQYPDLQTKPAADVPESETTPNEKPLPEFMRKAGVKSWDHAHKLGLTTMAEHAPAIAKEAVKKSANWIYGDVNAAQEVIAQQIVEQTKVTGNMEEALKNLAFSYRRKAQANTEPGESQRWNATADALEEARNQRQAQRATTPDGHTLDNLPEGVKIKPHGDGGHGIFFGNNRKPAYVGETPEEVLAFANQRRHKVPGDDADKNLFEAEAWKQQQKEAAKPTAAPSEPTAVKPPHEYTPDEYRKLISAEFVKRVEAGESGYKKGSVRLGPDGVMQVYRGKSHGWVTPSDFEPAWVQAAHDTGSPHVQHQRTMYETQNPQGIKERADADAAREAKEKADDAERDARHERYTRAAETPHLTTKAEHDAETFPLPSPEKNKTGHVTFTEAQARKHMEANTDDDHTWEVVHDYDPRGRKTGYYNLHKVPTHKKKVKDAIARGEQVPANVLADYPDLQPKPSNAPTREELAKAYGAVREGKGGWWAGESQIPDKTKAAAIARHVTQQRAKAAHADGKPGQYEAFTGDYRDHAQDAELEAMQPKDKPALLNPITAKSAIDQINDKNTPEGGWTDADRVPLDQQAGTPVKKETPKPQAQATPPTPNAPTGDVHAFDAAIKVKEGDGGKKEKVVTSPFYADTIRKMKEGTLSHDEFKQRGEAWFGNRDKIIEGLKQRYKETGLRSPEKIQRHAEATYEHVASMFNLGEPVSVQVSLGNLGSMYGKKIDAYKAGHDMVTPERLADFAKEHSERMAKREQAMTDPQSLDDFEKFTRVKGEAALTSEQRARYDDLRTEARRERDRQTMRSRATVGPVRVDGQGITDTPHSIHEGIHTKHKTPIHVVKLENRVDKDHFKELAEKAKQLGGSYQQNSRYSGGKTPDGFNFDTPEKAQRFSELLKGNTVSRAADWEEAADMSREAASSRLHEMADRMEAKAQEALSRDRLTNTARRANFAASAEAEARGNQAHAKTLRRIGDALKSGQAKHLAGFRHNSQIEALDTALRMSVYGHERVKAANARATGDRMFQMEHDRPATAEDIDYATYPYPHMDGSNMMQIARTMQATKGAKRIGDRLEKYAQEHLFENDPSGYRSSQVKQINDRELLRDLSDVATNPAAYGLGNREGHNIRDRMHNYMRLQAADVKDATELRAALREYRGLRQAPEGEDKVKAAERNLVGKKIPGFFPTPRDLVSEMVDRADIQPGHRVFEPSAGKGDILDMVRERHPDAVAHGMEINRELADLNALKGHDVQHGNFNDWTPSEAERPDRIVMNPPFENGQDMDHVQRAFEHLKPGGKMVAIMSEGPFGRNDAKSQAFRQWLETNGGYSERLPEGSFQGADAFRQTGVNTRMVVIHKPG